MIGHDQQRGEAPPSSTAQQGVHRWTPPTNHTISARRGWKRYSNRTFYLFIAPWLLGFLGLTLLPMLYALLISFTSWDGIAPHWHWIGLANYAELLHDRDMWFSLGRTLFYTTISVPLSIAAGLGLALLLNRRMRAVGFFRTVFYLPSIVPIAATAIAWKLMFDRDAGAVNAVIEAFGGPIITWLIDPRAFLVLIIMVLWGLGGGMVISLAGLQGIPQELREAAKMDGANPLQVFMSVTLPLLSPVLLFQVVTGVIYALQTFVQPILLSIGTPGGGFSAAVDVPRSNYFYMINVFQQFFFNQRFGYGSAMLWFLFLALLLLTVIIFRSSARWVYYEVE